MSRAAKPVQALDAFDTLFVDMQTADFMAEQRKVAVRRIALGVELTPMQRAGLHALRQQLRQQVKAVEWALRKEVKKG